MEFKNLLGESIQDIEQKVEELYLELKSKSSGLALKFLKMNNLKEKGGKIILSKQKLISLGHYLEILQKLLKEKGVLKTNEEDVKKGMEKWKSSCCNSPYKKLGRAKYVCAKCKKDVTLELTWYHQALTRENDLKW